MRGWIEKVAKEACDKQITEFKSIINHFDRKLGQFSDLLTKMEARLNAVDKTILNMTKEDLEQFMNNRLIMFEGGIDDKIVGLYRSVDEKIANGNGNVKATTGLLRRIAKLEGISDAIESRRSTEAILERLEAYRKQLAKLDRTDNGYSRYEDAINILNWVLGENDG